MRGINHTLADSRGISISNRLQIQKIHSEINVLNGNAKRTKNKDKLRLQYAQYMEKHRELQRLWKFPQNDDYIKFWLFSKCTCPILDNKLRYPSQVYIKSGTCVIHGT